MPPDPTIRNNPDATCQAMQDAGLVIDRSEEVSDGPISPSDPTYLTACKSELWSSLEKQSKSTPGKTARIWSPLMVKTAADYAKKHGYEIVLTHSESFRGNTYQGLSINGTRIQMGLRSPHYDSLAHFELGLKHEAGHLFDNQIISSHCPELKGIISEPALTSDDGRKLIGSIITMLEKRVPLEKREFFNKGMKAVLGSVDQISEEDLPLVARELMEIFRYGEDAYLEEYNQIYLMDAYKHLKKPYMKPDSYLTITDGRGKKLPLEKLVQIAKIQESGMWDRFTKLAQFDRKSLAGVRSDDIAVLRLAMGAARSYIDEARSAPSPH